MGLGDLPTVYVLHLLSSLPTLLLMPSQLKKQSFLIIGTARDSSSIDTPHGNFSTSVFQQR